MAERKNILMAMMAAGILVDYRAVFADEHMPTVHSSASWQREGKKCGQCAIFGKRQCPMSKARNDAPACSQFKLKY